MLKKTTVTTVGLASCLIAIGGSPALAGEPAQEQTEAIFAATGARHGLVVHVGCRDGRLTAALHRNGANVVHGLDADAAHVAQARQHVQSLGLYGPVSVERWDAPFLPYVANLVTLLVVEGETKIPRAEMLRVLAPRGVAYLKQGDKWAKLVKPVPKETDEWTHYLHDASGNPVARDTVVGPPRSLQWVAGQVHGRSHEYTSSVSTVVSTAGRIFYISDLGPTFPLKGPADWQIVARDGYNGLLLWRRPIRPWFSHLCGWTQAPRELQRRMVAVGDRVYVTMGYFGEIHALDAATGKTVKTYPQTAGAEEVICHQGVLLAVVREITDAQRAGFDKLAALTREPDSVLHRRDTGREQFKLFRRTERSAKRSLVALDAATGKTLWTLSQKDMRGIRPLSLRAAGHCVYYQGRETTCLELRTG